MIWDALDQAAMRNIWHRVWVMFAVARTMPRSLHPVDHGTYALGRRPLLPLPREGIGSVHRPPYSPHTPTHCTPITHKDSP